LPDSNTPECSRAVLKALLFLFLCSPLWLAPGTFSVPHPAVLLAVLLGITLLFLRRDGRAPSVLGLDPSWRRAGELVVGFGGGALLIGVTALCAWAVTRTASLVAGGADGGRYDRHGCRPARLCCVVDVHPTSATAHPRPRHESTHGRLNYGQALNQGDCHVRWTGARRALRDRAPRVGPQHP
jgi:hypothetical protein